MYHGSENETETAVKITFKTDPFKYLIDNIFVLIFFSFHFFILNFVTGKTFIFLVHTSNIPCCRVTVFFYKVFVLNVEMEGSEW